MEAPPPVLFSKSGQIVVKWNKFAVMYHAVPTFQANVTFALFKLD